MTLDERIKDAEARNVKINEDIKTLGDRRRVLDSQITALRDEALKTVGEYNALTALKEEMAIPAKEPTETIH